MLEKPDISDTALIEAFEQQYGLRAAGLAFLPLGADVNTAVYRVETAAGGAYFLKLRRGAFDPLTVEVPRFLLRQGTREVIEPLETRAGRLWAELDAYKMVLYPFITGVDGYQAALTGAQWTAFGAALRGIHAARLPGYLRARLPREDFSPAWREMVRRFQALVETEPFSEPVAVRMAAFMRQRRGEITYLLERADQLARRIQAQPPDFVLCHTDLHAGNLLLVSGGGEPSFYIVDWDAPALAPKERDLNLIGGSSAWSRPQDTARFYQGYGETSVDASALAYYRYERVIEDIAAFGQALLLTSQGGEDREQSYIYFTSSFLPGHEIDFARQVDEEA